MVKMTKSFQSINYQDTDLEGDSIRDILEIRVCLLLLFSCLQFKVCSCFLSNLFTRRVGVRFVLWFFVSIIAVIKSKKVPLFLLHCLLGGSAFSSCCRILLFLKPLDFLFKRNRFQHLLTSQTFSLERPPCHLQSTLKSIHSFFIPKLSRP